MRKAALLGSQSSCPQTMAPAILLHTCIIACNMRIVTLFHCHAPAGQYAQQGLERWRAAAQGHEAALLVAVGVTLAAAGLAVVALRAKAASGR